MYEKDEESKGITQFLDEISARSSTETAADMRAHLLAFSKVRSVLTKLELEGIQVLEPDFAARYELGLSKRRGTKSALDFTLKKANVEIQLEVKYQVSKHISLSTKDIHRYYEVLSNNSRTEEILVTWSSEELPTLALDLAQLQRYISKGKQISVETSSLRTLEEAVKDAFDRHMPDWYKVVKITPGKGVRYDPEQLFVDALIANVEKIKAAAETRRYVDRKQVSESITDIDIRSLVQIYKEGRVGKFTPEYLEEKLKQIASWNSTAM